MTADLHARIAELEAERDDAVQVAMDRADGLLEAQVQIDTLTDDLAKAREERDVETCRHHDTKGALGATQQRASRLTVERDALRERVEKDYARLPGLLRYLRNLMIFTEPVAKLLAGGGPHEWGYRDITDGTFIADNAPFEMAGTLEAIRQALDGEKG